MLYYLLDGYNILNQLPRLINYKIKEERRSLINFIEKYSPEGKNGLLIVFDGYGTEKSGYSKIKIVFSRDISADDFIVKFLSRVEKKKQYRVVTDDRELGFRVKSLGSSVLKVKDFILPAWNKKKKPRLRQEEKISPFSKEAELIRKELEELWLKKK